MTTTEIQTPTIDLPAPDLRVIHISVEGTAPLICNRFSQKAKKQMLDKQMKKASTGKVAKNPDADYQESLYLLPGGGFGFPAIGFKAAAVRAGTYADLKMTFLRGAFHVTGEFVKIEGQPSPREDMVRIGNGIADIRYRGEFKDWKTDVPVRYNARAIVLEQVVNLFRIAGFSIGVGEWRPERDGSYGTFDVTGVTEIGS